MFEFSNPGVEATRVDDGRGGQGQSVGASDGCVVIRVGVVDGVLPISEGERVCQLTVVNVAVVAASADGRLVG